MESESENFVLLTKKGARFGVDVPEHHHEILVADTHGWWPVKHQIVDVDFGILVSEEVYGVENRYSDDCCHENDRADEPKPCYCLVLPTDKKGGLNSEKVEGWSEEVPWFVLDVLRIPRL